jgi:hypothetical protein
VARDESGEIGRAQLGEVRALRSLVGGRDAGRFPASKSKICEARPAARNFFAQPKGSS